MTYNVYDSKILAPCKCGSRYLDTVFDIKQYSSNKKPKILPKGTKLNEFVPPCTLKEQFFVKEWKEWKLDNLLNVKWVIIRSPEEITISGINTELLLAWNGGTTILSEEKKLVESIVQNKTGHYDMTLYRQLYFFYSSSNTNGNKLKFIHLKDLTEFAKEHLNFTEDLSNCPELHDFSNFPIFMNKKDMMDYFKRVYFNEWCMIDNNMKVETFFWELIQKNCEFYEPSTKTSS